MFSGFNNVGTKSILEFFVYNQNQKSEWKVKIYKKKKKKNANEKGWLGFNLMQFASIRNWYYHTLTTLLTPIENDVLRRETQLEPRKEFHKGKED